MWYSWTLSVLGSFKLFFFSDTGVWKQALMLPHALPLEPLHQIFEVLLTICLRWLGTEVILIFASQVARIAGVSCQCLVPSNI
jgi:hypothetical protein